MSGGVKGEVAWDFAATTASALVGEAATVH